MKTKAFTLVVCPGCNCVIAVDKDDMTKYEWEGVQCVMSHKPHPFKDCYKLGLKKIEKTGEEIWMGVKED